MGVDAFRLFQILGFINVDFNYRIYPFQLTDQEAAADEAIERLCLRCHNLETRLAEAQSAATTTSLSPDGGGGGGGDVTPNHTPTPSENGGRGRLSPVLEQGEDTEETECEEPTAGEVTELKSENANSGDLRSKYSSLIELYEAALERCVKLIYQFILVLHQGEFVGLIRETPMQLGGGWGGGWRYQFGLIFLPDSISWRKCFYAALSVVDVHIFGRLELTGGLFLERLIFLVSSHFFLYSEEIWLSSAHLIFVLIFQICLM